MMTISFSNRICSVEFLKYEERVALWVLRNLLRPQTENNTLSLARFFGEEVFALQKVFQKFVLQTVQKTKITNISPTELHILQIVAEMQNQNRKSENEIGLRRALLHLSMVLAAYGYWLPCVKENISFSSQVSKISLYQDNYPMIIQAAE